MPIYFFWGEDDFALNQACYQLQEKVIDPHWMQFNYDKISGTQADGLSLALNQAMTPVFGSGERLVWLIDTTICQHCPEDILSQLERTLSQIPISSHLLFTSNKKPDRRLKSTKILAKYTKFQEFSLLPPWKTDEILKKVKQTVQELEVKLT